MALPKATAPRRRATPTAREIAALRAQRAEAAGDLPSAARDLEWLTSESPSDWRVALRLAWVDFRIARYSEAEAAYRLAIQRGGKTVDAHTGLGWSLFHQSRCIEATLSFRRALVLQPTHPSAREGLATCAQQKTGNFSAWLQANGYLFSNHPWKSWAYAPTVGLSVIPAERLQMAAAYRVLRLRAHPEIPLLPLTQHEMYVHAGYATEPFGLEIHTALIFGDTGPAGTSPHVGVLARWSPKGDVTLDVSASFYDDIPVVRAAPAWRIPLGGPFGIVPGAAIQHFDDQYAFTGTLTLTFDRDPVSAWLGGKFGDEFRPAYLSSFVIYDIPEYNRWGVWAGLRLHLSRHVDASVSYSFDLQLDPATRVRSGMHFLSLGPAITF